MHRILSISINCGEKTCASEPGKFCQFLGSMRFGTCPVCMLFPMENPGRKDQGAATPLKEVDGWLQRCENCLSSEIA